jgi:hypothetical protein
MHKMTETEKKSKIAKSWKKLKNELKQAQKKGKKGYRSDIPLNNPPST